MFPILGRDQFGQEGAKQRNGKQVASEKSAKKGRKKTKKSSVEDTLLDSGNWINPKQTANMPKDAGRRRVHAHGQSAGHWITAENGKKVSSTTFLAEKLFYSPAPEHRHAHTHTRTRTHGHLYLLIMMYTRHAKRCWLETVSL